MSNRSSRTHSCLHSRSVTHRVASARDGGQEQKASHPDGHGRPADQTISRATAGRFGSRDRHTGLRSSNGASRPLRSGVRNTESKLSNIVEMYKKIYGKKGPAKEEDSSSDSSSEESSAEEQEGEEKKGGMRCEA